jgi:hypothetical protein
VVYKKKFICDIVKYELILNFIESLDVESKNIWWRAQALTLRHRRTERPDFHIGRTSLLIYKERMYNLNIINAKL